MPTPLRVATFNVENLFTRARLLNVRDNAEGDVFIVKVKVLQQELRKPNYTAAIKTTILELYEELKEFIEIVETRGKLFNRQKDKVVANGVNDWDGFIRFKRNKFSEAAVKNTGRVIRAVDADICCLVEVEDRPTLKHFCTERLASSGQFKRYPHQMAIDGNDDRGIDVSVVSRIPIGALRSHVDDKDGNSFIFSRDCLEVELTHPAGFTIQMLLNHFKSKGFGSQATSNEKRRKQAERVAKILEGYKLKQDLVIVVGDLNDTPDSSPLATLINVPDLHDVLKEKFPNPADRWTYHFNKNQQIDYLLVSTPLRDALKDANVERRGIFDVDKFTNGAIQPFNSVTRYIDSASDHGAVWAAFEI